MKLHYNRSQLSLSTEYVSLLLSKMPVGFVIHTLEVNITWQISTAVKCPVPHIFFNVSKLGERFK